MWGACIHILLISENCNKTFSFRLDDAEDYKTMEIMNNSLIRCIYAHAVIKNTISI